LTVTIAANDTLTAVTGGLVTSATDPWVLTIAFIGAVIGVAYRSIYPYLERAKEEEAAGRHAIHFLGKYKFTMGISFLLAIVTTMGAFDQLTRNLDESAPLATIFIISFTSAIGWNELTNRVSYKISDKLVEAKESTTAGRSLTDTLTGKDTTDTTKKE
jgi:uncharacterized membrane protein YfcA